ncbi:MAG TPA: beta-N-acetylhexosaminidase [Steroidobacteraceae bacterium]|nr:beta-N-acetylhexosaminidase [Steroidobacteraceae bacterium]HRX89096.1 beta-N-acetylhexosaminidase [Steroidobacteraceae bacterium]
MTLGPLMIDLQGTELAVEEREMLRHPLVGAVILFTRNFVDQEQLAKLVRDVHAARTPALAVAVDHEGGRVQRFRTGFAILPSLRRIGHEFDADRESGLQLARDLGWLMAAELRAYGVDLSFAPVVDLDYGVNEAIGDRAFHATADAVSELAVAYMHGMRDAGMMATAKHFPGHGAVVADSHQSLPVDRRSLVDLTNDLQPYRRLIANGLPGVMMAHVLFPEIDAAPAGFSRYWVQQILRGEFGFKGLVFSDDLSMRGAAVVGDIVERARRALAAGCDVLPICNDRAAVVELLDRLRAEPDPAAQLRRVRMKGHGVAAADELYSSEQWRKCREALARCQAPPALRLDAGPV